MAIIQKTFQNLNVVYRGISLKPNCGKLWKALLIKILLSAIGSRIDWIKLKPMQRVRSFIKVRKAL